MKRFLLPTVGATLLCGLLSASASAAVVELGATPTPLVAPVCPKGVAPAQCTIILTRATALETIRDTTAYPSTVKQSGRLVAFTVGLSALSSNLALPEGDSHAALEAAMSGNVIEQAQLIGRSAR